MKLSKQEQTEWNKLRVKVESWIELLNDKVHEFNALLIQTNQSIDELKLFAENVQTNAQENFDSHSEKWQEGERGDELQSFIDLWSLVQEMEPIEEMDEIDLDIEDPPMETEKGW